MFHNFKFLKNINIHKYTAIFILIIYIIYTNVVIFWKGPVMEKIFKNQKLNLLVIKKGLSSFKEKDNSTDEFDQNTVSLPNKFNPLEKNNENYNIFKYARNINQYSCGSCVCASLMGTLETHLHKKYGFNANRTLSIQNLLDCRRHRDKTLPYCFGAWFNDYEDCDVILDKCNKYRCYNGCLSNETCSLGEYDYIDHRFGNSNKISYYILSILILIVVICIIALSYNIFIKNKKRIIFNTFNGMFSFLLLISILCIYFIQKEKLGKFFSIDPSSKTRVYYAILNSLITLLSLISVLFIHRFIPQSYKRPLHIIFIVVIGIFYTLTLRSIYNSDLIDFYVADIYRKIYYILIFLANACILIFVLNPWINIIPNKRKKLIYTILSIFTLIFIIGYSVIFINPLKFNIYKKIIIKKKTPIGSDSNKELQCDFIFTECDKMPSYEKDIGRITHFRRAGGYPQYDEIQNLDQITALQNNMKYMIQKYGAISAAWLWAKKRKYSHQFLDSNYIFEPIQRTEDIDIYLNSDTYGHAIQVIGWTTIDNKKVWIIKNSWGSSWGNYGFFYISMLDLGNSLHRKALKFSKCKFMFIEGTGGTFPVIDFNKRNSYLQSPK